MIARLPPSVLPDRRLSRSSLTLASASDSLIDSIQVSPDPPVPGKNLTVTAKGLVVEPVTVSAYG